MTRHARLPLLVATIALATAIPGQMLAQDATPGDATPAVDPAELSPVVTNPYVPLASFSHKVLEGDVTDADTGESVHERVEEWVLPGTAVVAGVETTVVEVKEYADGELTEHTRDYYAQHRDGTVYYLGEDVDVYEDGELAGHEGTWRAGEGGSVPGEYMPADPAVGQRFEQERAPGVAEDISTVVAVDRTVTVPAGTFDGCIETEDVNPLDDSVGHKIYCPGAGIVRDATDEGAVELVAIERDSPVASPIG
jgi:hypothetical protein